MQALLQSIIMAANWLQSLPGAAIWANDGSVGEGGDQETERPAQVKTKPINSQRKFSPVKNLWKSRAETLAGISSERQVAAEIWRDKADASLPARLSPSRVSPRAESPAVAMGRMAVTWLLLRYRWASAWTVTKGCKWDSAQVRSSARSEAGARRAGMLLGLETVETACVGGGVARLSWKTDV